MVSLAGCGGSDDEAIVVFDGQSLNRVPVPDFPALVMKDFEGVDAENVAVNGYSWTLLAESAAKRRDPYAKGFAVLVMVGGTSDVAAGDDGPTIYADMRSYAESAREAGFDRVIAGTLQPAAGESAEQTAAREAANELILDDPDDAFDEVVDLAGTPGLDDPTGPSYYDPIGHPSPEGAARMAEVMKPAVAAALEDNEPLLG